MAVALVPNKNIHTYKINGFTLLIKRHGVWMRLNYIIIILHYYLHSFLFSKQFYLYKIYDMENWKPLSKFSWYPFPSLCTKSHPESPDFKEALTALSQILSYNLLILLRIEDGCRSFFHAKNGWTDLDEIWNILLYKNMQERIKIKFYSSLYIRISNR